MSPDALSSLVFPKHTTQILPMQKNKERVSSAFGLPAHEAGAIFKKQQKILDTLGCEGFVAKDELFGLFQTPQLLQMYREMIHGVLEEPARILQKYKEEHYMDSIDDRVGAMDPNTLLSKTLSIFGEYMQFAKQLRAKYNLLEKDFQKVRLDGGESSGRQMDEMITGLVESGMDPYLARRHAFDQVYPVYVDGSSSLVKESSSLVLAERNSFLSQLSRLLA